MQSNRKCLTVHRLTAEEAAKIMVIVERPAEPSDEEVLDYEEPSDEEELETQQFIDLLDTTISNLLPPQTQEPPNMQL